MGDPVSVTFIPLTNPSVPSIEIVLTRSSPRCCWHSSTTRVPSPLVTSRESRMFGNLVPGSSNATSTTGPITWVILPMFAMDCDSYDLNDLNEMLILDCDFCDFNDLNKMLILDCDSCDLNDLNKMLILDCDFL